MEGEVFTVDQVAALIDMHPKTIRRFIREGRLGAVKMGGHWRIHKADLGRFMGEVYLAQGRAEPLEVSQEAKAYKKELRLKVRVSSVVDVQVSDRIEADRLSTFILAAMNSRGDDPARARCDYIFRKEGPEARFLFCGTPAFTVTMLEMIAQISE